MRRHWKTLIVVALLCLMGGCASFQNPYEPGTVQHEQWETRKQLSLMQYQQQMQHMQTQQALTNMQYNQFLYQQHGF